MGKILVTGGTGFVGSHVVRALAERDDELRLLVRERSRLDHLDGIEFERRTGDVTERATVRRALKNVDKVFHIAGATSMRPADRERVFAVNVGGTRTVCEEALRAEVERLILTSSVGAIGPASPGGTADENQTFTAGGLGVAYINSKHEAECEAWRVAAHGLAVVAVNPSFVLGPDDPQGTSNRLVSRFLLRRLPFYIEGGLNIVDVRDVAAGHVLADEKGEPGERYILGGRNFTLTRLFADLARISGVEPPGVRVPGPLAVAGAEAAVRAGIPIPVTPDELRSVQQWWTYRTKKAQKALGFRARPHEETLEDTVRWQLERLGDRVERARRLDLPLAALGRSARLADRLLGR
ncbi:MAG TPA: NAD-dependent epimerase/dehydratase family protein [Solirubrobacterales bacterium]|nr:NAD-dependent epimerase/dehydratase family protein [Solirubrobacterales bacterium]